MISGASQHRLFEYISNRQARARVPVGPPDALGRWSQLDRRNPFGHHYLLGHRSPWGRKSRGHRSPLRRWSTHGVAGAHKVAHGVAGVQGVVQSRRSEPMGPPQPMGRSLKLIGSPEPTRSSEAARCGIGAHEVTETRASSKTAHKHTQPLPEGGCLKRFSADPPTHPTYTRRLWSRSLCAGRSPARHRRSSTRRRACQISLQHTRARLQRCRARRARRRGPRRCAAESCEHVNGTSHGVPRAGRLGGPALSSEGERTLKSPERLEVASPTPRATSEGKVCVPLVLGQVSERRWQQCGSRELPGCPPGDLCISCALPWLPTDRAPKGDR